MLLHFFFFTKDCPELKCQPPFAPDGSFVRAEIKKNLSPPRRDEFNLITGCVGQSVNPFSRKAKRLDRPAQSPVNMFETPEVDKRTPPIQPRHPVSNITIRSSGTRIKSFSNKAEALDRPTIDCSAANIPRTEVPPVQLSGFPSNNITGSYGKRVNPFSKRAIGVTKPSHIPAARMFPAQTVRNSETISSNDAVFKNTVFNTTTQYSSGQINPLSALDCPAANTRGAENENNTPPVHLKGVPSNNITDSSGNKVNPFSKRAKGITTSPHTPTPNFAEVETLRNSPAIISNDAAFKNTGTPGEINPFSKKARGMIS